MRRVYQTKFGGPDVPWDEQGDCMQAALATLLGIPLEEAFDFKRANYTQHHGEAYWWTQFVRWCGARNLYPLILNHAVPAYGLAGVVSHRLFADDGTPLGHQVVTFNREVVHDPGAPFGEESYEADRDDTGEEWIYLIPIDPVASDPLPALAHRPRIPVAAARSLSTPTEDAR